MRGEPAERAARLAAPGEKTPAQLERPATGPYGDRELERWWVRAACAMHGAGPAPDRRYVEMAVESVYDGPQSPPTWNGDKGTDRGVGTYGLALRTNAFAGRPIWRELPELRGPAPRRSAPRGVGDLPFFFRAQLRDRPRTGRLLALAEARLVARLRPGRRETTTAW